MDNQDNQDNQRNQDNRELIKKYANRKLYHTNRKQYITLDGIAHLIQSGSLVHIVDNETGEDITSTILAQVVLQVRGRSGGGLPTTLLTNLIRFGGNTLTSLRYTFLSSPGGQDFFEAEIGQRLETLVQKGFLDGAEALYLRHLLLYHDTLQPRAHIPPDADIPTQDDIDRLHQQIDALLAEVEEIARQQGQNP